MTQAHVEVLTELSVASRRPVPRKWLPGFLTLLDRAGTLPMQNEHHNPLIRSSLARRAQLTAAQAWIWGDGVESRLP